jgi:hypothetical protein
MATPYLYVKHHGAQEPVLSIGTPPTYFVWNATIQAHKYTPADDAAFNAKALELQTQENPWFVIAGV